MIDNRDPNSARATGYQRLERAVLKRLPPAVTALRLRILAGYLIIAVTGFLWWRHIESAWQYLLAMLVPIGTLLGALLALKLGVVVVTLFTLITSLFKVFAGFLMLVLKPGILKAIFIPPLKTLVRWIHRKSATLQLFANGLYERLKLSVKHILQWWQSQHLIDKVLMSGFLIPLLIVVLVVFLIERAIAVFAIKKLTEQVVQLSTRLVIRNFHRIPLIGALPARFVTQLRQLTLEEDRKDLATDFRKLGDELSVKSSDKPDSTEQGIS